MITDWVTTAASLQAVFLKQESFRLPPAHPMNLIHFLWHFQIDLLNDHLSQKAVSSTWGGHTVANPRSCSEQMGLLLLSWVACVSKSMWVYSVPAMEGSSPGLPRPRVSLHWPHRHTGTRAYISFNIDKLKSLWFIFYLQIYLLSLSAFTDNTILCFYI